MLSSDHIAIRQKVCKVLDGARAILLQLLMAQVRDAYPWPLPGHVECDDVPVLLYNNDND